MSYRREICTFHAVFYLKSSRRGCIYIVNRVGRIYKLQEISVHYSKICVKRPLKNRQKKGLKMTTLSLMKVERLILLTCIKR